MTEAVLVALIAGVCSVFGQWLISRKQREDDAAERARLDERTAQRLASIEKKLDTHNGYAAKISQVQQDIAVIENEIRNMERKD